VGGAGNAEGQAVAVVGGLVALDLDAIAAPAERGQARISYPNSAFARTIGEGSGNRRLVRRERHLRPQLVEGQALDEDLSVGGLDIEPAAVLAADDEHVEQQAALRGEKGCEPRLARGEG